jgi:hypothetical protein
MMLTVILCWIGLALVAASEVASRREAEHVGRGA